MTIKDLVDTCIVDGLCKIEVVNITNHEQYTLNYDEYVLMTKGVQNTKNPKYMMLRNQPNFEKVLYLITVATVKHWGINIVGNGLIALSVMVK